MSISLTHNGLPDGVTTFLLCDLIDKIAQGSCKSERLSATAVRLIKHYIRSCRPADFEKGKICGVWEQPQTMVDELGISTKVLHNAEAELRDAGFIERTHSPHARRSGKRHNGDIIALAGISLRPLIDGYATWTARRDAIELQNRALFCLKQEVAALNREIRRSEDEALIDKAQQILPRGRVSRLNDPKKLEAVREALKAVLVLLEVPSGATNSSHRTEEIVTPNVPKSNLLKNRSGEPRKHGVSDQGAEVTPELVAGVSSADYQSLLPEGRPPTWRDLLDASAIACRWHGISEAAFGQACERLGRERAAVSVMVIDRNARLPQEHRYRARSGPKCFAGLLSKPAGLWPMLRAAQGYPEGETGKAPVTPAPLSQDHRAAFGSLASAALARLAEGGVQ